MPLKGYHKGTIEVPLKGSARVFRGMRMAASRGMMLKQVRAKGVMPWSWGSVRVRAKARTAAGENLKG